MNTKLWQIQTLENWVIDYFQVWNFVDTQNFNWLKTITSENFQYLEDWIDWLPSKLKFLYI
jgi:hypothetical protein